MHTRYTIPLYPNADDELLADPAFFASLPLVSASAEQEYFSYWESVGSPDERPYVDVSEVSVMIPVGSTGRLFITKNITLVRACTTARRTSAIPFNKTSTITNRNK